MSLDTGNVPNALADATAAINGNQNRDKLGLESMTLLVVRQAINNLNTKSERELHQLKERQGWVSDLHKLQRTINNCKDASGNVNLDLSDPAIAQLLSDIQNPMQKRSRINHDAANPLDDPDPAYLGLEFDPKKGTYTKDEATQLLDNVRSAVEDLNVENDMRLQSLSRLMNERYEAYQLARAIMKPLHDDMVQKARAIKS